MKVRSWLILGFSLLCYCALVQLQILLFLLLAGVIVLTEKTSKPHLRKIFSRIAILLIVMGFVAFKTFSSAQMLIGYSVFAFSGISFVVDQYKDRKVYSTVDILAYLFFFPKMMAGPIVRPSDFIPQLALQLKKQDCALYKGFKLVLFGCFMKFIVADNLLDTDTEQVGLNLFLQSLVWAVRFYLDFYSYSIIAVGLALWCGIILPYNFDNPYSATSFRDFWKRWNLTLTSWLRDYVYIPLGGNKLSKVRMLINVLLTFIVSGLWHGISIPFVLWGGCHGLMVCVEKNFGFLNKNISCLFKILYRFYVVVSTMLLWQLFRFKDIGEISAFWERLFISSGCRKQTVASFLIAIAFLIFVESKTVKLLVLNMGTTRYHILCEVTLLSLMLALLILCPYKYTFNFFYFNF